MATQQPIRPSPKTTPSPPAESKRASSKAKDGDGKMHKRSRSGCFTCRLRRKKCDESRPICRACKHLGVECEYKRPTWWQHPERRRQHKELIKDIIGNTKKQIQERPREPQPPVEPASINTPPSLCHSLPTTDAHSDIFSQTRAPSVDSHFSPQFDIETPRDFFNSTPMMPPPQWTPMTSQHSQFPYYSTPFELEVKTENQMFVNDIPTQKDSVTSTFLTFQQPPLSGSLPTPQIENWVNHEFLESHNEMVKEEPYDPHFFDFPHAPFSPSHQATITVDDADKHLLDHFLGIVSRLVFPILDVNQHGSALADVILPALESNKCYLHCCLSTAAVHLKATGLMQGDGIDTDIMRHRYATISELCEAFDREDGHPQTLEATLGLILFQASVGSPEDGLPDIPWHQHFHAAHQLIEKLGLLVESPDLASKPPHVSFNTTLASWIDILGATILGRVPLFAGSYREKIEAGTSSGLQELMGCDDKVMYLISEIACLDSLKQGDQLDDLALCGHIVSLGEQLSLTQYDPQETGPVYSPTGAIRPKQLSRNITAIYRLAARIYLCSLVPAFDHTAPSIVALVSSLADIWNLIPTGPEGFDRSLVWPLLIAGSVSTEHSSFRRMWYERCAAVGDGARFGSFGRTNEILADVWAFNDSAVNNSNGEKQSVHWRDVMRQKGRDCLLI